MVKAAFNPNGDEPKTVTDASRSDNAVQTRDSIPFAPLPAPSHSPSEQVVAHFMRVAHQMRGVLAGHFSEFGLTAVRHSALRFVRDSGPNGCSQAELAQQLHQSESSTCALVDRMRADRLLYRLRSKSDRRKRVLRLTDKGRETLARVEACHDQRMADLLSGFDSADVDRLGRLLDQLHENLSSRTTVSVDAAPELEMRREDVDPPTSRGDTQRYERPVA